MSKVYVAGKFQNIIQVRSICERIEELGHEITYDWTTHEPIKPYADNARVARIYSHNEAQAIAESDIFIWLSHKGGTTLKMEYGGALMASTINGKPLVYAVGEHNDTSPWLFHDNCRRRDTIDEVIEELSSLDTHRDNV